MTNAEMKEDFLILYDKLTNFDAPGYTDNEISILLTKGQERFFLDEYSQTRNRDREGFEQSEKRRKDLGELVKGVTLNAPSASQLNALPNGTFYDLPEDCLFVISEEATLSSIDSCINNERVRVTPVTHDEYSINKDNPYKKPNGDIVWRMDYQGNKHELITDGSYTISAYHLRYIKKLSPIIVGNEIVDGVSGPLDCELNTITHRRIIDEAVRIATGITNSESYQIKTIEQQESE